MTETRYLQLLWIYIALTIAAIVAMFFPDHSESLAIAYDNEPTTWLMSNTWVASIFMGSFAAAWLAGLAGLFRFKRWARTLSLYSTLASFLIAPFMGASLSSGLETSLFEASTALWGAILALSYFSAVRDRFGR